MKIHFLKTEWSDIIILQDKKEIALIDTGFEEQFDQISDYLKKLVPEPVKIKFILNTHFHRDHYGCISKLTDAFKVEKVFLKEYSGLDCTTAWGTPADDEYRHSEMEKFQKLKNELIEKDIYAPVEGLDRIVFSNVVLYLYNTENTIRLIYEDESNPETYHKIMFSENTNSLCAFVEIDSRNIFFGGDSNDLPQPHPLADSIIYKAAQKINRRIDLYKVPHHGTRYSGLPETLEIFKPKKAVFTNSEEFVSKDSDALANLKKANLFVKALFTKEKTQVIDTEKDLGPGTVTRLLSFFCVLLAGIFLGYMIFHDDYFIRNVSNYLEFLMMIPLAMVFVLVPPIGFLFGTLYFFIGYGLFKWLKKGKVLWFIVFAVVFILTFNAWLLVVTLMMSA